MFTPSVSQCIGMDTFQTYLNDKASGLPLSNGTVTFYSDIDRTELKNVWQLTGDAPDYTLIPIPNPNSINSDGTLSDGNGNRVIPYFYPYNENGQAELYYITVYNSNAVLQETLEGFPPGGSSSSPSSGSDVINYIPNPQFLIWDHVPVQYTNGSVIILTGAPSGNNSYNQLCDSWYFTNTFSAGATHNASQQVFASGQTAVPGNPRYYLQYQCTAAGTETSKRLLVPMSQNNFQFLSGQTCTFQVYANADTNGRQLQVKWGTVTSAGVIETELLTTPFNLTTSWAPYTATVTIPSAVGIVSAQNYSDYCYLTLEMDLGVTCTYSFCNVLLQLGSSDNPVFPYQSYSGYLADMDPWWQIPTGSLQFALFGTAATTNQYGWISLSDQTMGNQSSGATVAGTSIFNLYCYIWSTINNQTYAPVSSGSYGANPVADWNAGYTIKFYSNSRLLGASGSGTGLSTRAAGQTGGAETSTSLINHTHTFNTNNKIAAIPNANNWVNDGILDAGAVNSAVISGGFPGATVTNLTATDSAGTGASMSLMNPFTFLPLYIHI